MLSALAEAGAVLGRSDYVAAAEKNAAFVLTNLRAPDGRLLRTWRAGRARLGGYLEDYAALCEGLVCLYHATFAECWVLAATSLADIMLARFRGEQGEFYDTADDLNCFWCARATCRTTRSRPEAHWPSRRWRAWRPSPAWKSTGSRRRRRLPDWATCHINIRSALGSGYGLPSSWCNRLRRSWWWGRAEMIVPKPSSKPHARDSGPDASSRTQNRGRLPLCRCSRAKPRRRCTTGVGVPGATCLAPVKDEAELRRILRAKA